jgi:hypothetical protein
MLGFAKRSRAAWEIDSMYSILECARAPGTITFCFANPGVGDDLWTHMSFDAPLVEWLERGLLPLAVERGKELSVEDVVARLMGLAESRGMLATSIDWLGLALLAAQEYREVAAALHEDDTPELQARCAACSLLAMLLYEFDERLAHELEHSVPSAA